MATSTWKMILVSGMLVAAIACTKEKEEELAPQAQAASEVVQGNENTPVSKSYVITRFEQGGVENAAFRDAMITFGEANVFEIKMAESRGTLAGTWSYNADKDYVLISVPGTGAEEEAISSDVWKVTETDQSEVTLQAESGEMVKWMRIVKAK